MSKKQENMLGESTALTETLDHLSLLATINRPVLVIGERGTGKELAAERLHFLSPRWGAPFIKVNCAAMSETLLESELFGHEAGAFTGATRQHLGRFERADGGTLLLDEIGTTSAALQEKLLRLIEYGEYERVGGQRTLQVDVRVVGATNANLPQMAREQRFRADLLDRLSFDVVHMPPLRERGEDIEILARHFAMQMSAELGWPLFPDFSPAVRAQLLAYPWPGNVRELKNAVERSLHRWGDPDNPLGELLIDPFKSPYGHPLASAAEAGLNPLGALPVEAADGSDRSSIRSVEQLDAHETAALQSDTLDLRAAVDDYERRLVAQALIRAANSQRRGAEALGLSYDQMRHLVRKHGLRSRKARGDTPPKS
ncbi:MAG: psp operon transcriptional activator [Halieaceae bacterium]|jgi:psp operon transcriptional activator